MEGPCRWGEGQAWGLLQRQGLWGRVWPRQELGPGRCQALLVPLQKGAGGGGGSFIVVAMREICFLLGLGFPSLCPKLSFDW